MKPAIVVDVGNSRIKWGRCARGLIVESASLPTDDPAAWASQRLRWAIQEPISWAIAGVHPEHRDALTDWIHRQGDTVQIIANCRELPLDIQVDQPERVGIDRLLNAVAARSRLEGQGPAIIVDAGTAITVDYLDEEGAFRGGAIMPGLRLMTQSLHDRTALLPLIPLPDATPTLPGTSTEKAISAGVFWAVVGGIRALLDETQAQSQSTAEIFLTGGDASLLCPLLGRKVLFWPTMTLEGIRISALGEPPA